jgi:hypothetical protein
MCQHEGLISVILADVDFCLRARLRQAGELLQRCYIPDVAQLQVPSNLIWRIHWIAGGSRSRNRVGTVKQRHWRLRALAFPSRA